MFSEDEHGVFKSERIFYERYELGIKITQRSMQQRKNNCSDNRYSHTSRSETRSSGILVISYLIYDTHRDIVMYYPLLNYLT